MKFLVNILISAFLFPSIALAASHDPNRVLTPSADSVTSVAQTGAKLEDLKAECGCTERYIATGDEIIDWVRGYNRVTKTFFRDVGHNHTFAAGSILWMNPNGKVGIAQGCLNAFAFKNPVTIFVARRDRERSDELQGQDEVRQQAPPPQPQPINVYNSVYVPQQTQQPPAPVQDKKGFCSGKGCKIALWGGIAAGITLGAIAVARSGHDNHLPSMPNMNQNQNVNVVVMSGGGQMQRGSNVRGRSTPSRTTTGQKLETSNPYRGGMSDTPTYGYVGPRPSPLTGVTPAVWQNTGNVNPNGPNIASQNTSRTNQPVRNVNPTRY